MSVALPPDVEVLRRLVRGELSRNDRIAVDCWLGRCTDERVINVLDNLILEWEEEKADARLPAPWAKVSAFFRGLSSRGLAAIDLVLPQLELVPSFLGPQEKLQEGLSIRRSSETDAVKVLVAARPDVRRVALLATTDRGDLYLLKEAGPHPGGEASVVVLEEPYRLSESEGRSTFWAVLSTEQELPRTFPADLASLGPWLDELQTEPGIRLYASRVTSPHVLEE
jgi:hypothetical protein